MEHSRFLRLLIIDAQMEKDVEDGTADRNVVISQRDQEKNDREHLELLCTRFDTLQAEARQKMWDLIKIPIAPASLIAMGIEGAVFAGWLQKEIGYVALVADLSWATYELIAGIVGRSRAIAGRDIAVTQIQAFLLTQSERATMVHRAVIDCHEPELRQALTDKGVS